MKKLIVICIAALMCGSLANAQSKGEMAVGANLAYGSGDGFSNIGIGAKFQYTIIDNLRLEPSFTYFLKKDYVSMYDFSVNAHYLFSMNDKGLMLYPIAGLGILGVKVSNMGFSASSSDFGINLGAGAEMPLSEKLAANAEFKYKMAGDWNRALLSVGVAYKF